MQRVDDLPSIADQPGPLPQRVNKGWHQPMLPSNEKCLRTWFAEPNQQLQVLLSDLQQATTRS